MSNIPCEICGASPSEKHHIIPKAEARYLEFIPVNFMYLCPKCHRGSQGPHRHRHTDQQYRYWYWLEVQELFDYDSYYQLPKVAKILQVTVTEATKLLKPVPRAKEGYSGKDILARLSGGRIYY